MPPKSAEHREHPTRRVLRSVSANGEHSPFTVCSDKSVIGSSPLASQEMPYSYRDDPILGPALAYWQRIRAGRTMPLKRDLDPVDIPARLLPHLQIIDVVDGGRRFRYRLIGTSLVESYGKDYTGTHADELVSGERRRFIHSVYQTVCTIKAPVFSHNCYHTVRHTDLFANRIYMPLSHQGYEVGFILGALSFTFADHLHAGCWGSGELEATGQYVEPVELDPAAAA